MRYPASGHIFSIHTCDIIFDQSAHSIFACCQALAWWFAIIWSFLEFLCWSFSELKLSFMLKFIIKWRQAGLSRYFSTLGEISYLCAAMKYPLKIRQPNKSYGDFNWEKDVVICSFPSFFSSSLSYYTQIPEAKILAFCCEHPKKHQSPRGRGGGNVLSISSDGDDLIGPKLKTEKNSQGFQQNLKISLEQRLTPPKKPMLKIIISRKHENNDIT